MLIGLLTKRCCVSSMIWKAFQDTTIANICGIYGMNSIAWLGAAVESPANGDILRLF